MIAGDFVPTTGLRGTKMNRSLWLISVAALLLPATLQATDYFNQGKSTSGPPEYVQAAQSVDVSKYSSTEMEIKQSLIRVLFARGWAITAHTRYKVTAQYKDTTMEASINGQTIEFREVSPAHKSDYGWISGAANSFLIDIQYYYHVRLAEQMMSSGVDK